MKKITSLLLAVCLMLSLCACGGTGSSSATASASDTQSTAESSQTAPDIDKKDVVILYTNDVHCGVNNGVGYAGLSAIKNGLTASGLEVLLVDNGDAVQGGVMGTLSEGEYIIELMNKIGYDAAIPGNHEFDYGMDRFFELREKADFPYISSNFADKDGKNVLDPYMIVEKGGYKIALVGVCTPTTTTTSTPTYFMNEKGEFIYSFGIDESGEKLYKTVQNAVDSARDEGADFVVLMAHLGIELEASPWTSSELIENTHGIDVVLDGHSHSVIECEKVRNSEKKEVILTSTGTKLANVGCLRIGADGGITTKLISNADTGAALDEINTKVDEITKTVVAHSDFDLIDKDPETGERLIRRQETNLGDLCADAIRYATNADAAFVNGGGIRASLKKGDITYGDIINVHPYGNELCSVEATGQEILDALEMSVSEMPNELGGFQHVSGIKYTVDLNVESGVKRDENNMFAGIEGERRIKNVTIGGEPLDPEKIYTVAGSDFFIKNSGDGFTMFSDNKLVLDGAALDNQALIDYIKEVLGGVIGEKYADIFGDGRMTVIEKGV